jgi:hypothetical protein
VLANQPYRTIAPGCRYSALTPLCSGGIERAPDAFCSPDRLRAGRIDRVPTPVALPNVQKELHSTKTCRYNPHSNSQYQYTGEAAKFNIFLSIIPAGSGRNTPRQQDMPHASQIASTFPGRRIKRFTLAQGQNIRIIALSQENIIDCTPCKVYTLRYKLHAWRE